MNVVKLYARVVYEVETTIMDMAFDKFKKF